MNILDAFGARVAFGSFPTPKAAGTVICDYVEICSDYTCKEHDLFECNYVFECGDYMCSYMFTCNDYGGGNDFTCYNNYAIAPGCSSPVPSTPCPGT